MQPSFDSQHVLDIPSLISLVLDSTDWTLLKTNVEEGQGATWHVRQDSFLRRNLSCSFKPIANILYHTSIARQLNTKLPFG